MKKNIVIISLIALLFAGCKTFSPFPHSRNYEPLEWEKAYFDSSIKNVMPSDIVNSGNEYVNKQIHWVGIIDTFFVTNSDTDSSVIAKILFDQKFYDYIEDFSIQDERIFLSPKGDGKFEMVKVFNDLPSDSVKASLSFFTKDKSLGFCYGVYQYSENGMPVLEKGVIRFIPHFYYSTNIFSYDVERDSTGKIMTDKEGLPVLTDFKTLNLPGAGQNK